ncbi:MAG: class I SAM-dependent methyltransferase [Sulfuricaulis sp.]
MSTLAMFAHLLMERLSRSELPRTPESKLVVDDPAQVTAFMDRGRNDGILTFSYFFHALQASSVIHAGDTVLDMACGPANQLAQIALLNPDSHFIGLDASANMLDQARCILARYGITNVELVCGDMVQLGVAEATIDCVISTMSLHHLPDLAALSNTMRGVQRVLKPDGGLYIADFGRLKRANTQRYFAEDRRDCQSAQFTQDFLQSMQAAFSIQELDAAIAVIGSGVVRHQTAWVPFLVTFSRAARCPLDAHRQHLAQQSFDRMSPSQQRDFLVLSRWFRAAGYILPCTIV